MTLRVIQWTTGNVGRRALQAILGHPDLELVGVFAHNDDKKGVDAATLCGLPEPTGVLATNDVDALLDLRADACTYNPLLPDINALTALLESGVNVCSTAGYITGRALGSDAVQRLRAAAERGNASIFGTGVNPGFANLLALVTAGVCDRVDQIRVLESVDLSTYSSPETMEAVGFAHPVDEPGLAARAEAASAVFGDAVAMMADALGVALDDIAFDTDYTAANVDSDLGFMTIPAGTVAAMDGRWRGRAYGRDVIILRFQWTMGSHVDAPFAVTEGWRVEIDGEPSISANFQVHPPDDGIADVIDMSMIATAMPCVNAIPAVVAAPPGLVTYADLPLITASGYVTPR